MRVAWVVAYPVYGGPHNHIQRIAPHLRDLGVQACVVLPDESGNAATRLARDPGLEIVTMPLHRLRVTRKVGPHADFVRTFLPETGRLARLFRERAIDVVVQTSLLPPHAGIAARRAGLPLVCQVVDTRIPPMVAAASMQVVRALADHAMFDGDRLIALHTGGRPLKVPIEVYFPPVDTSLFVPSAAQRAAARAAWAIPTDAPVVGMVANLNPQKGWEYFVRAAAIIYREVPGVRFLMVGASYDVHRDYNAMIEREMAASGVPRDLFVMTGDCSDVETLLPAMDVKLITSVPRSEGTTTTGLEALSCGVPVVGVDVGAIGEWLSADVGFLVKALDPVAIADATVRVLSDPALRARMAANGREMAIRRFDARQSAVQHKAAFEAAREHHAARGGRPRRGAR